MERRPWRRGQLASGRALLSYACQWMAATRPDTARLTMADELRFLCDEMLTGLGRWLRIAGYV
jgi:hypothetical protein